MTPAATAAQDRLVEVPSVLPSHHGRELAILRIALGGGVELALTEAEHRELLQHADLDTEVTIRLSFPGTPPIDLVGAVTSEEVKLRKVEGSHVAVAVRRVGANRESTDWDEGGES